MTILVRSVGQSTIPGGYLALGNSDSKRNVLNIVFVYICHDLAKQPSQYLFFFSFLFFYYQTHGIVVTCRDMQGYAGEQNRVNFMYKQYKKLNKNSIKFSVITWQNGQVNTLFYFYFIFISFSLTLTILISILKNLLILLLIYSMTIQCLEPAQEDHIVPLFHLWTLLPLSKWTTQRELPYRTTQRSKTITLSLLKHRGPMTQPLTFLFQYLSQTQQ